jgi:hypothetical protein
MARINRNMVRTNVYLPEKVKTIYQKLAKTLGRPYSELVREDLTRGLKLRLAESKAAQTG